MRTKSSEMAVMANDSEPLLPAGPTGPLMGGGKSPFNFITNPDTNKKVSIFSKEGKALLKEYVKSYKKMQSGGAALLDGVGPEETGALYDGIQNAGAEYLPDACNITYDASQDVWVNTQL